MNKFINFHILTLFPKMFDGPFSESMIKRAQEKDLISINIYNLRDWGIGKYKQVDDTPYGGGAGMVMRVDVVDSAILKIKDQIFKTQIKNTKIKNQPAAKSLPREASAKWGKLQTILLTPQGKRLDQKRVKSLAEKFTDYILICGHYEGFDERIRNLVDEEISIGDYILTGGEIPAMVLVDAVSRLIPGVLGKEESAQEESFDFLRLSASKSAPFRVLEYPQYTRPEDYKGEKVPKILLSGDHKKIAVWRIKEAVKRTKKRRPDLLK